MADATLPVLYSFRRCPYAMRARLALLGSEQSHDLREVELRSKPHELLEVSSKGTVPVLVTADGDVIDQSLDIMLWSLRRHDPLHWLPSNPDSLHAQLALIAACDGDFKQQLDRYKYPGRYDGLDEPIAHRDQGASFLLGLDLRLSKDEYLAGDRSGLVDAAIFPFVRQFSSVDATWFNGQPWPRLQDWLRGWLSSALFARAMQKHPVWKSGTGARIPLN